MALRRVPGARNYQAEDRGFDQIALGTGMVKFMDQFGKDTAGNMQAVGKSEYDSEVVTAPGGWENKPRASARIYESKPHPADARNAIMVRVLEAMTKRRF